MKITNVEAIHLRLEEVLYAKLETMAKADSPEDVLIIKVETDEGIVGYGEAYSASNIIRSIIEAPVYHAEFSRGLKDILIGQDPFDVEVLWEKMYRACLFYGRRGAAVSAISGIDIALWDIIGKAVGKPVFKLLGGGFRSRVRAYASSKMPMDRKEAKALAANIKKMGFTAVKFGYRPVEIDLIYAVKEVLGDDILIMIDAGPHLDTDTAVDYAKACEKAGVYWLEEPLLPDNLEGYAFLMNSVDRIKIATGENESTRWGFRELIDKTRPHIIQPDLARAGGISEGMRINEMARAKDIQCTPHAWGSAIMFAASLQFIAAIPNCSFFEFCVGSSPLVRDLVDPSTFELKDGYVDIPTQPGLGITINEEIIDTYRIE